MAQFNKSEFAPKKKKDNRWLLAALLIIILLLLLATVVPLDKIPGLRKALVGMGYDDIENRDVTLVSVLTGASNLNMSSLGRAPGGPGASGAAGRIGGAGGGYDASRSDLYYTMSAVSPFEEGPLGATYLLDAQRLREAALRSGSKVPQVYAVAKGSPDGYFESSDSLVDASKFNSAQQGLGQDDVPFAREDAGGPPVESSLSRLTGGGDIKTVNPRTNSGTLDYAARNMGKAARGQLQQMAKYKNTGRRGRAPLGDLQEFGPEPLNQAGTSWLFTRAGERARMQESKRTLSRAAFDGSVRPDEVVLKQGESTATVSDQASIDKDAGEFVEDKRQSKACQDAVKLITPKLNTLRDDLHSKSLEVINQAPECCPDTFTTCRSDDQSMTNWDMRLQELTVLCGQFNDLQDTINTACGMCSTRGGNRNNSCEAVLTFQAAKNNNYYSRCDLWKQIGAIPGLVSGRNWTLRPLPDTSKGGIYTLEVLRVLNEEALIDSVYPWTNRQNCWAP